MPYSVPPDSMRLPNGTSPSSPPPRNSCNRSIPYPDPTAASRTIPTTHHTLHVLCRFIRIPLVLVRFGRDRGTPPPPPVWSESATGGSEECQSGSGVDRRQPSMRGLPAGDGAGGQSTGGLNTSRVTLDQTNVRNTIRDSRCEIQDKERNGPLSHISHPASRIPDRASRRREPLPHGLSSVAALGHPW